MDLKLLTKVPNKTRGKWFQRRDSLFSSSLALMFTLSSPNHSLSLENPSLSSRKFHPSEHKVDLTFLGPQYFYLDGHLLQLKKKRHSWSEHMLRVSGLILSRGMQKAEDGC